MDVTLRDTVDDDLPILFEHQRDPVANEMAVFPPRDWDAFVAHQSKIRTDPAVTTKTIVVDGEVAGGIGCWGDGDERDVGYWIGREHWGRGIATAALAALLELVPERPLMAHVAARNGGSIRVLERCGFVETRRETSDVEEIIFRLDT